MPDTAGAGASVPGPDAAWRSTRLEALFDANPTGLMVVDERCRVELVNASLLRLLDIRREPAGRPAVEVLHVAEAVQALNEALKGEGGAPRAAVLGEYDLLIEATPVPPGAMLSVRDVTWQRAAERARTEFVANVSHELRTPIAIIRGFAETLLADRARIPEDLRMMVEAIERNGLRLGYLFDDLLTLYRIETRRRDLPRERLAVRQVIAETARSMLDRAERSGVRLSTACEDGLVVWSNREALDTILSNLVSNACKYTPRGGRVLLRARSEGTGVTIDVIDTGIGIARQHHDRIFERFYRVDDGRARAVGGTGLGLAIAKHYAQAVGAVISLRSEENHGSTFSIHITETGPATGAVGRVWEDR